jgi:hypothetical protein
MGLGYVTQLRAALLANDITLATSIIEKSNIESKVLMDDEPETVVNELLSVGVLIGVIQTQGISAFPRSEQVYAALEQLEQTPEDMALNQVAKDLKAAHFTCLTELEEALTRVLKVTNVTLQVGPSEWRIGVRDAADFARQIQGAARVFTLLDVIGDNDTTDLALRYSVDDVTAPCAILIRVYRRSTEKLVSTWDWRLNVEESLEEAEDELQDFIAIHNFFVY